MRQTVESDVGQAEIQGMKAEIHRMEVYNTFAYNCYRNLIH